MGVVEFVPSSYRVLYNGEKTQFEVEELEESKLLWRRRKGCSSVQVFRSLSEIEGAVELWMGAERADEAQNA